MGEQGAAVDVLVVQVPQAGDQLLAEGEEVEREGEREGKEMRGCGNQRKMGVRVGGGGESESGCGNGEEQVHRDCVQM